MEYTKGYNAMKTLFSTIDRPGIFAESPVRRQPFTAFYSLFSPPPFIRQIVLRRSSAEKR